MDRFEIRIAIDRPLATVFAVYTQTETWGWCSYIREIQWVRGTPWEEESRLRIEVRDSLNIPVDQVLIHFEPDRRADFICHFGGVTLQSRVGFRALSDSQTEVHNQSEFLGTFSRVAGFAMGNNIHKRTRQFFDDLKRECERVPLERIPSEGDISMDIS